jgi:hypothetical protein
MPVILRRPSANGWSPRCRSSTYTSAAWGGRHRFTDVRHTRNRFATSRSLASASIISVAASRTRPGELLLRSQPAAMTSRKRW